MSEFLNWMKIIVTFTAVQRVSKNNDHPRHNFTNPNVKLFNNENGTNLQILIVKSTQYFY